MSKSVIEATFTNIGGSNFHNAYYSVKMMSKKHITDSVD